MPKFELTPSNDFSQRAIAVVEPAAVEARLQELSLDLTSELFYNSIFGGLGARNETTAASAVTAPGLKQWLQTVEVVRQLLGGRLWRIHNEKNCPFVSSTDGRISIVVMTGDSETGRQGFGDPTNQAEKGIVAESFVRSNRQLELFNEEAFKFAKSNRKETQVWAFLYHYDKKLKEVRYELSYPTGFERKKISKWGERLILGSIPDHPSHFMASKVSPNAPAAVQVEPKSGTFN